MDCNIWFHVDTLIPRGKIPEAQVRIEKLHELHQRLQEHLAKANEQMAKYYNQNHIPKQFKRGQLIKLSTKNLKLKYLKLAP
jgi:CRISPR/Cas system endoribonuclease Cas6 (RAMP superfamily)